MFNARIATRYLHDKPDRILVSLVSSGDEACFHKDIFVARIMIDILVRLVEKHGWMVPSADSEIPDFEVHAGGFTFPMHVDRVPCLAEGKKR